MSLTVVSDDYFYHILCQIVHNAVEGSYNFLNQVVVVAVITIYEGDGAEAKELANVAYCFNQSSDTGLAELVERELEFAIDQIAAFESLHALDLDFNICC